MNVGKRDRKATEKKKNWKLLERGTQGDSSVQPLGRIGTSGLAPVARLGVHKGAFRLFH
jgi:hypothetical protein